jgi:hypothetical protein
MFSLFRAPLDRRFIDAGRVACPVRGRDVDVDRCAGCQWLVAIDDAAKTPSIRCRPDCVSPGFLQQLV